jgi:two-component system response regulator RegA
MSENKLERFALVVDDDDVFRNRLCRALEARGWKVDGAPDGTVAIKLAKTRPPDLAIVDLRLAGMGGLEVVRELRSQDETMRIIMLTGYGSIATALIATNLGADDFLSKPADADQIVDAYQRTVTGAAGFSREIPTSSVPSLARVEWEHMQRVLTDCNGNISQAARLLGLHRRSLQRKLAKYPPRD